MKSTLLWPALALCALIPKAITQIPTPNDAPKPLSPAESAKAFSLPPGIRIQLLASEPLIREPSGVCWDEQGRLFVCELHGYNLEGQFDVDELNKSGKLDFQVRRVQASEESKRKADAETYGTLKLLQDSNGDGIMDKAIVWADRIPPCYGVVAAEGGILVACSPDILFLKDTDGDGRPDVCEKRFTGFKTGMLERAINSPVLGPDGWIYFGKGWAGSGPITGPHLQKPVQLPDSDFRIRPDGTAIEPVSGSTRTVGITFTSSGDRFVCETTSPGRFVTPIEWRYLARNPDASAPALDEPATNEIHVFPIAPVHPWRTKREQHPEYFALYRKYNIGEAVAAGYFTSACGPLVYQHDALPNLQGHYLVCEPAASAIHRSTIVRDGTQLRLKRLPDEQQKEFLASRDSWFHPVSLTQAPNGAIAICDFYREIIEDYSAIPRHLQQQYGVVNGQDRGRIWLLLPEDPSRLRPLPPSRSAADARVLALRAADSTQFKNHPEIERELLNDPYGPETPAQQALQAALSLGQSRSQKSTEALLRLARQHGHLRWMDAAIASSAHQREAELLRALADHPGNSLAVSINLAGVIAARNDAAEIQACLQIQKLADQPKKILQLGLEATQPISNPVDIPPPSVPTAEQNAQWEKHIPAILAALKEKPDIDTGRTLFTAACSACHRSHGIGTSVGPDLDAEFQRAPETILRDVLFPSEAARPGYETLHVKTKRGESFLGIIASDSPTSLTLRLPGGIEKTILKKNASIRTVRNVSLMPPGLGDALQPRQIADIIAFLRSR